MASDEEKAKESPLSAADETALDELLARDPENLTAKDIDKTLDMLVPKLRAEREAWEKADEEAHKSGKKGSGPKRELPEGAKSIYDLSFPE